MALLARHGGEIQGMSLQSYLFFGSASGLQQKVKQLLSQRIRNAVSWCSISGW